MNRLSRIRRGLKPLAGSVVRRVFDPLRLRASSLRNAVFGFARSVDRWLNRGVGQAFHFTEGRLGLVALLVLAAVVVLPIVFWDWLQTGPEGLLESGSTTIRNVGLVVGGVVAALLAVWRSRVAEHQVETAQQSLLNERYQRGAEMLGSDVLTVRLGGIYALQRLAMEHPKQYHIQIMQLFCAFVRHPTKDESELAVGAASQPGSGAESKLADPEAQIRQDVQAVMTAISACHGKQGNVEYDGRILLNLKGASLAGAELWSTNFSSAHFVGSNLSGAILWNADLSGAILWAANLTHATLQQTNLTRARLKDANLSGAKLSLDAEHHAIGVTQKELDRARADPDDPPDLDGVADAETGEPLVWRGKPLDEEG